MRDFKLKDFDGAGQYLLRMCPEEIIANKQGKKFVGYTDAGYLTTIVYKVGYVHRIEDFGQCRTLTSMADGWTQMNHFIKEEDGNLRRVFWASPKGAPAKAGRQKFVDHLNNDKGSEYRFATQEEVVRVVMSQNWRWK